MPEPLYAKSPAFAPMFAAEPAPTVAGTFARTPAIDPLRAMAQDVIANAAQNTSIVEDAVDEIQG